MKKLLFVIVIVVLAATFLNDLGAYVNTRRGLIEATREAAEEAAGVRGSSADAARAAAAVAAQRGATVYHYEQDGTRVEVWARADLEGTWVYGTLSALAEGRPRTEPLVLTHYETQPRR